MTTSPPTLRGDRCRFTACGLAFTSTNAFDKHRTGTFAPNERRCRTEAELRARGFEPNDLGYWRVPMTPSQVAVRTSITNSNSETIHAASKSPKGRASQSTVDDVHGFVARAILDTFKHYRKPKELPPSAFLAQAIKFIVAADCKLTHPCRLRFDPPPV